MQWKWIHQILEKVVLTALKVSLTVQDICEVLARHWGSPVTSSKDPRNGDQSDTQACGEEPGTTPGSLLQI